MGNVADVLVELVRQYPSWTHAIIGLGVILQGEIAILLAMFLVVSGALPWREFFIATLGTLAAGELIVFFSGRLIRHTRLGWRWYWKMKPNRRIQYYSYYLRENLTKLLVTSRFLIGINFIVLVLTGWSKTSFGKFVKSYLVGLLTWFGAMTLIAYSLMSGLSYLRSERVFRRIEIGIVVIILIFFGGEFIMRKLLKKKISIVTSVERMGQSIEEKIKTPGE
ncbi:MAG: VTT domain-containing protein [Candidatus Jorgensenbacteria bacterium]